MSLSYSTEIGRGGPVIVLKESSGFSRTLVLSVMLIGISSVLIVSNPTMSEPINREFNLTLCCASFCGLFGLLGLIAGSKEKVTSDERKRRITILSVLTGIVIILSLFVFGSEMIPSAILFCCCGWIIFGTLAAGAEVDTDDQRQDLIKRALKALIIISLISIIISFLWNGARGWYFDFFLMDAGAILCGSSCFFIATLLGVWNTPGQPLWLVNTETTLGKAREHEAAGRLYDAAVLYQRVENWNDAGRIYVHLNQFDKALIAYEKAENEFQISAIRDKMGLPPKPVQVSSEQPSVVGQPSVIPPTEVSSSQSRIPDSLWSEPETPTAISQPSMESTATPPTTSITERFERRELLATGGMATVYLATDRASGTTVVWKQAHSKFNPLQISNIKMRDEVELLQHAPHARMARFIEHASIRSDTGEDVEVIIIEFISGGDLKNTVEQVKKMGMQLPAAKVLEIMRGICEPLEHLAALPTPIYHRDLKPQNVIVHPQRGPILIDFGLAKQIAAGQDVSITRGGSGTWTAPERDSGVSGSFTDVYSLGKMLYFLCTSEQPPAIMMHEDIKAIVATGHPQWMADLCLRAVWPKHEQRIQTMHSFRLQLDNEGRLPTSETTKPMTGSDEYTTWG